MLRVVKCILASMMFSSVGWAQTNQTLSTTIRQVSRSAVVDFPVAVASGVDANGVHGRRRSVATGAFAAAGVQPNGAGSSIPEMRVKRSMSREQNLQGIGPLKSLTSPRVVSRAVVAGNPRLSASFNGIDGVSQRLANGGNQFDNEPPDQGLCVGNGFVLESINAALRVYDAYGHPLTGVTDLNTFYGYAADIDRTTGLEGPFLTDPSCYYDPDTQRWFAAILTFELDPVAGWPNFTGPNHVDIAVSTSPNPTGGWVIYRVPVQDDGTGGTPNHGCSFGPCYGDFPHIGADKYGFYVTTNEYSLFGPEFKSAQIYALSKRALASNAATVSVVQIDTTNAVRSFKGAQPGFTIWPAIAAAGRYFTDGNGTEFFMSSNAAQEANGVAGGSFSNELIVWALSNTESLDSINPTLHLSNKVLRSEVYGIPPFADQKTGDVPQAVCLNVDCFGFGPPPTSQVEGLLDASDTRILQAWYANGRLWGTLNTVLTVDGQDKVGIAYFSVNAYVDAQARLGAELASQGYVAVGGNNAIYPTIAVLPNGKGVMAFTLVGQSFYPSAAYALLNQDGVGDVHVAAPGLGPQDGFTEYWGGGPPPRWGDYGAAATDGSKIWIASEYIAQTCNFVTFLADMTCGGTRDKYVNWATRISKIVP